LQLQHDIIVAVNGKQCCVLHEWIGIEWCSEGDEFPVLLLVYCHMSVQITLQRCARSELTQA
jgi:hypothetical protein